MHFECLFYMLLPHQERFRSRPLTCSDLIICLALCASTTSKYAAKLSRFLFGCFYDPKFGLCVFLKINRILYAASVSDFLLARSTPCRLTQLQAASIKKNRTVWYSHLKLTTMPLGLQLLSRMDMIPAVVVHTECVVLVPDGI